MIKEKNNFWTKTKKWTDSEFYLYQINKHVIFLLKKNKTRLCSDSWRHKSGDKVTKSKKGN